MNAKNKTYRALISSDWSECLAPCSPFDPISFNYPELDPELESIFKRYTGNIISLGEAARQIQRLLSKPITQQQMDAYLNASFSTYKGVPELIDWCSRNNILFMVNTTALIGYFQQIFADHLLPRISVLSAHPAIRYAHQESDPDTIFDLFEIEDKSKNTAAAMRSFNIPADKIILIGDSGGDGPHFKWGAQINALLIGCMTKASLKDYCVRHMVPLAIEFGMSYAEGDKKDLLKERQTNFMDLVPFIEDFLDR